VSKNRKKCRCGHPERWHELDNGPCHGELDCLCQNYHPLMTNKKRKKFNQIPIKEINHIHEFEERW
jgi:hypothetical protein